MHHLLGDARRDVQGDLLIRRSMRTMPFEAPQVQRLCVDRARVRCLQVVADLDVVGAEKK